MVENKRTLIKASFKLIEDQKSLSQKFELIEDTIPFSKPLKFYSLFSKINNYINLLQI